jgi:predicted cupin superfamily sugar epimerase
VASDEIWLWQGGDPLDLLIADDRDGEFETIRLGVDRFQAVVPGGAWQAARPASGAHGYALVGCVVVPGFDFADFEM